MSMKHYVCPHYPFYAIGDIRFDHGVLSTDNSRIQKIIESNDWFGVFITISGEESAPPPFPASDLPVTTLGMLSSRPVVHDRTNVSDDGRTLPEPEVIPPSPAAAPIPEPPPIIGQKLVQMKKQDLMALGIERGLSLTGSETRNDLIKLLKEK